MGFLLRYLGQTQVVGEMVAGVLLGPSFLGLVAPAWEGWLFPAKLTLAVGSSTLQVTHPSMSILYTVGQLGLVLYMFMIGLDFDTGLIGKHFRQAGTISIAGIVTPLILGGLLGFALAGQPGLFGPALRPWQGALFLAAALAVTAFPVLARILSDLGLTRTRIGTVALGAAATNDVTAWCMLAPVLATASSSPSVVALAVGGGAAYALFMLVVGRRVFARFEFLTSARGGLSPSGLALIVLILVLCAAYTDNVGIHSVFGAFILGVVMPRGRFSEEVRRAIEKLAMTLIVPIFFVYSGLNTHVEVLADATLLRTAAVVILVAFLAKGGACFLASRLHGTDTRTSAAIGALMNARGLMELILINIGLDRGLITPSLFTILVLMTIVTTMVAAPAFRLLYPWQAELGDRPSAAVAGAPTGARA